MPLLSGLSTGVKHGTRLRAKAISMVLWAAKIEPLSDSHCTGCGARSVPKRCSTERTIMSRIISPEIPAVVATQAMTSRSWQSRAKATRTTSPFQAVNSSASEHQRQLALQAPRLSAGGNPPPRAPPPGLAQVGKQVPPALRQTRGGHSAPRGALLFATGTSPTITLKGSRLGSDSLSMQIG